jgi:hypothetical protein
MSGATMTAIFVLVLHPEVTIEIRVGDSGRMPGGQRGRASQILVSIQPSIG